LLSVNSWRGTREYRVWNLCYKTRRRSSQQPITGMSYSPFKLLCLGTNKPPHRFEAQLTAVKERLESAKAGSTRGLGSPAGGASYAGFGGVGSRIAKPLRGGGGGPVADGPVLPVIGNLQKQDGDGGEANKGKRTSWFFNQR